MDTKNCTDKLKNLLATIKGLRNESIIPSIFPMSEGSLEHLIEGATLLESIGIDYKNVIKYSGFTIPLVHFLEKEIRLQRFGKNVKPYTLFDEVFSNVLPDSDYQPEDEWFLVFRPEYCSYKSKSDYDCVMAVLKAIKPFHIDDNNNLYFRLDKDYSAVYNMCVSLIRY